MEAMNTVSGAITSLDDDYMVIFDELGFMFDDDDDCLNRVTSTDSETFSHATVSKCQNLVVAEAVKDKVVGTKRRISGSRRFNRAVKSAKQRSCDELVQCKGAAFTLYTFPSFDRSDALIYLPTSLSRHMNAGDMKAMSKLLTSHLQEDCIVNLSFFDLGQLNVQYLIKTYEILQELHPDTIACSTNITVQENKIKASIYSKFTDCKVIQKSMRGTVTDPAFAQVVGLERVDGVRLLQHENRSQVEMDHFIALAGSQQNLLIYMRLELEMTVDDLTKKVTQFSVSGRVTSMHPVDTPDTADQ